MKSHEYLISTESVVVPAKHHDVIDSIQVMPKNAPFNSESAQLFSLAAVPSGGSEESQPTLHRISDYHKRSFELQFGEANGIYWNDEYNNVFFALSLKGSDTSSPAVMNHTVSPSGFAVYGLQDNDALARIIRASETLRKAKVDTEVIVYALEPEQLPVDEKLLSLAEFKAALVRDPDWKRVKSDDESGEVDPSVQVEILEWFKKTDFYFTVRSMQTNERLCDLLNASSEQDQHTIFKRAFNFINFDEKRRSEKEAGSFKELDPKSYDDISHYLNSYLPTRLGKNLARMHNKGLIHKFLHPGNISTVGSIYDLDSVEGEILMMDDKPVTDEQRLDDVTRVIDETSDMLQDAKIFFKDIVDPNFQNRAVRNFTNSLLNNYAEERGWNDDLLENSNLIAYTLIHSPSTTGMRLDIIDKVVELSGLSLEYTIPDNVVDEFKNQDLNSIEELVEKQLETVGFSTVKDFIKHAFTGIPDIDDRYLSFVWDGVKQQVRKKNQPMIESLTQKYGEKTEIIIEMGYQKLAQELDEFTIIPEPLERYQKNLEGKLSRKYTKWLNEQELSLPEGFETMIMELLDFDTSRYIGKDKSLLMATQNISFMDLLGLSKRIKRTNIGWYPDKDNFEEKLISDKSQVTFIFSDGQISKKNSQKIFSDYSYAGWITWDESENRQEIRIVTQMSHEEISEKLAKAGLEPLGTPV